MIQQNHFNVSSLHGNWRTSSINIGNGQFTEYEAWVDPRTIVASSCFDSSSDECQNCQILKPD